MSPRRRGRLVSVRAPEATTCAGCQEPVACGSVAVLDREAPALYCSPCCAVDALHAGTVH